MSYDNSGGRYDWMKRAQTNMQREMEQGGPVSDAAAHALLDAMRAGQKVNETQNAIIPYIEKMAAALAEAARASAEAGRSDPMIGRQIDADPIYTLDKWLKVLRDEAVRIIKEQECIPQSGTRSETSMLSSPNSAPTTANQQQAGSARPALPTGSSASKDDSSGSK